MISRSNRSSWTVAAVMATLATLLSPASPTASTTYEFSLRGRPQHLHLYGNRSGIPVVVSSSDGGWVRLGPHIAELLAIHGFFVVGFDTKAYLESFTSAAQSMQTKDEPADYRALLDFARGSSASKAVLVGVSEGAGLSVLAATDPANQRAIDGVIGVGLPDLTELGWRWSDAIIYVTHGVPNEPTFSTAAIIDKVAPVPLSVIHASHDEFVPVTEIQRILSHAGDPKQLRLIAASNHRFEDALPAFDRELIDSIDWARHRAGH